MKGLCVATYVFGQYTAYIAPYIFFLKRAYPDSFPLIFVRDTLPEKERQALSILAEEFSFKIVENHFSGTRLNNQQYKALRWLLWDDMFTDFEGVYIGDIDLFILPEPLGILEGHLAHCALAGLPYSNVIRPPRSFSPKVTVKTVWGTALRKGIQETFHLMTQKQLKTRRLSGLHFFIPSAYKEGFFSHRKEYLNILLSRRGFLWHRRGFGNEDFLYDMMESCGWITGNIQAKERVNESPYSYRPHHGVHVGVFSRREALNAEDIGTLKTDEFRNIYSAFEKIVEADSLYKRIKPFFSPMLREDMEKIQRVMAAVKSGEL